MEDHVPPIYSRLGKRQKPSDIARLMTLAIERPDILSLAAGFTDTCTLPLAEVSELVGRIAAEGRQEVLQYGANQGRLELREAICRRLEGYEALPERSLPSNACFVSNGSQQALYLAMQTLCDAGDIVLVEDPTYFVFLEILRGLGIEPLPMPMRPDGEVDADGLEELLKRLQDDGRIERVKALYLVSYYANPTGHSVSEESKKRIGAALQRTGRPIAVIEDAAYRDLYFEQPHAARGCLALPEFSELPVLYTSTLTKPYATGLKVGFGYTRNLDWLGRMMAVKGQHDFGTAHLNQAIMELALLEGRFDRHLRDLRRSYRAKMEALEAAIGPPLRKLGWSWKTPSGGLYLWLQAPSRLSTGFDSRLQAACLDSGVMFVPGELCFGRGQPRDRLRLSFGVLEKEALRKAGRRFVRAAGLCASIGETQAAGR